MKILDETRPAESVGHSPSKRGFLQGLVAMATTFGVSAVTAVSISANGT